MDALGGEQGFDSRTGSAEESNVTNLEGTGGGQAPVTFKTSFKTAIVNRKSAMLLLSQAKANNLQTLCSFLPTIVLRKLSRLTREEASVMRPTREDFHGCAVVMLDMCGFTSLAEGLRQGKLLLNNDGGVSGDAAGDKGEELPRQGVRKSLEDEALAKTYSRTMMSAKLLRLQTTEEGQAGFGAEQLKVVLNSFFKRLMSTITDHEGDVLRLAGDALIVAFTDGHGNSGTVDPCLLRRAALVSALCLKRLDGTKIQGHVMHLHVALGVGTLQLYTVGSAEGGWQYVAAGEPFSDLATAMDDGTAGELVASCNYWTRMSTISTENSGRLDEAPTSHAETDFNGNEDGSAGRNGATDDKLGVTAGARKSSTLSGVEWASNHLESGNVKVETSASAAEIEAALERASREMQAQKIQRRGIPADGEGGISTTASVAAELMRKQEFLERVIRRFIPPPILYVCEAEESGWFAEIGRVAVIFVNIAIEGLPGMGVMQSVFLVLQRAMKSNQGVIKEFSVDDKGTVMVGAMGLPPITGSNPSARACVTAIKIMKGIEALGIVCYVGISFGPVFTASIGGTRREFMLVGDVVNTAARLMSAGKTLRQESIEAAAAATSSAEGGPVESSDATRPPARFSNGVVVVDSVTAGLARELVEFEQLGTISLKGKAVKVEVYTPLGPATASRSVSAGFKMIGRAKLRATLLERASSLMQGFEGGLLVLQGEPGVGKTLLLEECGREWQREGVQTLGLTQAYLRVTNGAPFSAWRGIMHSVLLLYRSLVLAAATPDETGGSARDGSASDEERDPLLRFGAHAIHLVDHTLATGNTPPISGADERNTQSFLRTQPSFSDDPRWAAAQASADAEATAAAAAAAAAAAEDKSEAGARRTSGGHVESEAWATGICNVDQKTLTQEQSQRVQDMASQLDTEARILRTMHSDDEPERAGVGREQQGGGHRGLKTHSADAGPSSSETGDRGANENQNERVGGERPCEHPDERNQKDRTSSLAPNPGNDTTKQQQTARGLRPSPPQVAGFSGEMERDETFGRMPWWAGAFGAVPRMKDSPQARGLYVLRFCEIFFPDNVATATEARIGNLEAFHCRNRPATVLCTLLEGEPPAENIGSASPPTNKEDRSSGDGDVGGDGSTGGGQSGSGGVESGSGGGETGRGGGGGGKSSEGSGRLSSGSGGNDKGGDAEGDGKPEKSRFSVLLGMLTIATMVDAEGKAAASWAAKSAAGRGQEDQEVNGQAERGARLDSAENEDGGSVGSSVGSGVRGVVAVLDDGHEMDPCSCDLVKASTKYLHQRLLVVLVSPPLPGIITKHRHASGSCASHGGGKSDSEGHGGEYGDEDSSTACTSGSEDESVLSDDDPDLTVVSHVLPILNVVGDLESGGGGGDERNSMPGSVHSEVGPASTGVSCSEPVTKATAGRPELTPPYRAERGSRSSAAEHAGGKPDGASGGNNDGKKARKSGGELGRKRNGDKVMRRTSKPRSRTSDGGSGGAPKAPGSTLHLQQIGAAAFMEAGNAATSGGDEGGKPSVVSLVDHHGRRDSGFIRYWNPGTVKLLDILVRIQHKTTVETVLVRSLRYEETVQLGCRHLGCDELDPVVGVALYLQTNGNPLSIIGYCNLMVERNLGEVTLTTTGATPTTSANPSHTASAAAPKVGGSAQPPAVEANKDDVDISTAEPSTAAAAAVAAMLETAVESVAQGLEGGNGQGLLAGDNAAGDEKGKHETQTPQNNVPPATIFRFQENMNVFKVLEGTVPSSVESRIIAFLGCLSAQQSFILRVMSVIGTRAIEAELVEAVYPIPIKGSTLREDLHALEACRLIKIDKVANETHPGQSHAAAAAAAAETFAAGSRTGTERTRHHRDHHRLTLSFRDLVIHQASVVYKRLSHNHRNQLHGSIADWLSHRQQQSAKSEELTVGDTRGGARRRGSFEGGKAVAMGETVAPTQFTPMIVHHLTLAHHEQKAMIRAHIFGVKELEQWAMGTFAVIVEKHAVGVPEDLLRLAKGCKDFMWLCPNLIGILKTLLAIRSGAGVSNATTKFRDTMRSTRAERVESSHRDSTSDVLPATKEGEEEGEAARESPTPVSIGSGEEERPESVEPAATPLIPVHQPQDELELIGDLEGTRSLTLRGVPKTHADKKTRRCSTSSATGTRTPCPLASNRRGKLSPPAAAAAGLRDTGRLESKEKGGRGEKWSKKRGVSSGGGGRKGKRQYLPPLSLEQQQSWSSVPSAALSRSLIDVHSIYSSLGGAGRGSRPRSFGVITGPFTSRQRSFKKRHMRPRTADGTTSPTRSGVLIFVTKRSNFDFSGQQQGAVESATSHSGHSPTETRRCSTARPHHRGGVKSTVNLRRGFGTEGTSKNAQSHGSNSDHLSPSPRQNQRPKTVPLDPMRTPSHREEDGPCTWFRAETPSYMSSALDQHTQGPWKGAGSGGGRIENNTGSSGDRHRRAVRRVRARTAMSAKRTGPAAASAKADVCRRQDLIVSPERAAARLANIRKVYGSGGTKRIWL
ncbi:unnamed protein product [Ectocarpus sp. 6 AP-2014]